MSEVRQAATEVKISDYENSATWVVSDREALKQEIGAALELEKIVEILGEPGSQDIWGPGSNRPNFSVRYVLALQAGLAHLMGAEGLGKYGVDGYYGSKNRALVKKFQTEWNQAHPDDPIKVDGIVGPQTLPRLISQLKQKIEAQTVAAAEMEEAKPETGVVQPFLETVEESQAPLVFAPVLETEPVEGVSDGPAPEALDVKTPVREEEAKELGVEEVGAPSLPAEVVEAPALTPSAKREIPVDIPVSIVLQNEGVPPVPLAAPSSTTEKVTESIEVLTWQPLNFVFKDEYRQWDNETEGFRMQPFERTEKYDLALARIEGQIKAKLEPHQVAQPLKVNMTYLSRAEVTDKEGNVWLFSTHDVFQLQTTRAENQATYETEQTKFDALYQKYVALRQRVSSFTKQHKELSRQNNALALIDTAAENQEFWTEFNDEFKGVDMTFTDKSSYVTEYNASHPDDQITTEQAYQKWKAEWDQYERMHQQLKQMRPILSKAYRQSSVNLLAAEDGEIWEEAFNNGDDTTSTVIRRRVDEDGSWLESKGYGRGYLSWENQYSGKDESRTRTTKSYSGNTFLPQSEKQQYYDGSEWVNKSRTNFTPEGSTISVEDFEAQRWNFFIEGETEPFIFRDLEAGKVYIPYAYDSKWQWGEDESETNYDVMRESRRNPERFIDWFAEQIKNDPIRVKLQKVNLFLQASFEYRYDSKDPNNPDAFGDEDEHGHFVHHYSEILSDADRRTENGLFGDDCDGFSPLAEVLLQRAGVATYTMLTKSHYASHATAVILFKENGRWQAGSIGTYGLDINGIRQGLSHGLHHHSTPPYPEKNTSGYDTQAQAINAIFYKLKLSAREEAEKDDFSEQTLEEVEANFRYTDADKVRIYWTEKRGKTVYSAQVKIPLNLLTQPKDKVREYIAQNEPWALESERTHSMDSINQ